MSRPPVHVIKIGSGVLDNKAALQRFLDDVVRIHGAKILVHGGGAEASRLSRALGIETRMIDGRRITDANTLKVVTMVYGGLFNRSLVAGLQARGVVALGLCGADGDIIRAQRRARRDADFGFVGDVERVNARALDAFLADGYLPVIAPLTHDGTGTLLNTNADTIAGFVARALATLRPVSLCYCFDVPGVLADPANARSVLPELAPAQYRALCRNGAIRNGMRPKLDNAFDALRNGVSAVTICDAGAALAAYSGAAVGTRLTLE